MAAFHIEDKRNTHHQSGEECQDRQVTFNRSPIIVLMAVSGCYNIQEGSSTKKVLYRMYQIVIFLIMLAYLIRSFSLLTDISILLAYIYIIMLSCMCVANCLIGWKTFSKKYGHYHTAIEDFIDLTTIMIDKNITIDMTYYRRRTILIMITAILLLVVCTTQQAVAYFHQSLTTQDIVPSNSSDIPSFTSPFEDTPASRLVLFVPVIVMNFPFVTPSCFLVLISVMLLTMFNALNKHIAKITNGDHSTFITNVETLRSIHVQLCDITSDLDKDLGYFYGNIFMWVMGIGIVVLYIVLKGSQPFILFMILMYYFILTLTVLVVVAISASLVNKAAHAPLDMIYKMDVQNASLDQSIQLNLFLSKLTGTQVGFTICGLLTITKEFILTIAGLFLTYFAVLYTL